MLHLLLTLSLTTAAERPPLEELIGRVQSRYESLQDFEARFIQRYLRRAIRKSLEERGTLAVKRPGRMRWEYQSPEPKLFITDGAKSYFYLPEERQVIVSHGDSGPLRMEEGSPLALLTGRGRLAEAFQISYSKDSPAAGGVLLELGPRRPQEEFVEAALEVDPRGGQVKRLVLVDSQGNQTEFLFETLRENQGLPDSLFRFTIPPGVDVVLASDSTPPSLAPGSRKP